MAQTYPVKPVRLIVGYTSGGGADTTARLVAQRLSELLGRQMVVENRPGASGTIATERVATAPPDGYTLLLMTTGDTVQPALRSKLPYDLQRDLAPVSQLTTAPFALTTHPAVPARNIKELVALARVHPGKLSFGSSGVGASPHLAAELFKSMAAINMMHVPYKGGTDAIMAMISGQIDMSFTTVTAALPLLGVGKLKALAVTTGRRASMLPAVPTMSESGVSGYSYSVWYGVLTPAATPADVIGRLNAAIVKAVDTPETREALQKQGLEPQTNTPNEFAAFIRGEIAQNAKLIRLAEVKPE
jgi:tripartite-type tricarboxylate transporter receptor subunit TctC